MMARGVYSWWPRPGPPLTTSTRIPPTAWIATGDGQPRRGRGRGAAPVAMPARRTTTTYWAAHSDQGASEQGIRETEFDRAR